MPNAVSSGKMAQGGAVQPAVLYKLIIFAVLMAVAPIGTYFASLKYFTSGITSVVFRTPNLITLSHIIGQLLPFIGASADYTGSTTFSAIYAVVAANIVLVGYVVAAFREDAAYPTPGPPPLARKKEQ